jgi:hypothetical protein
MIRRSLPKHRRSRRPAVLGAVVGAALAAGAHRTATGIHADIRGLVVVSIVVAVLALAFVVLRLRGGGCSRPPQDTSRS